MFLSGRQLETPIFDFSFEGFSKGLFFDYWFSN